MPRLGLASPKRASEVCLELEDHSTARRSAIDFFRLRQANNPHVQAARLSEQFVTQNRALAATLDVRIERDYDGSDLHLVMHSGSAVGAIPLVSPTTARHDYGLVVQPRFPWPGIGPMLAEMGWRIVPTPLRLPLLHRSERRVPPWVLSLMILVRVKALLDSAERRFEIATEIRSAPRGTVHWTEYAAKCLPRAAFLSVPCSFPDLRNDHYLRGAARHTIECQLRSLGSQREHGGFVHRLIEMGQQLLQRVRDVPPYVPPTTVLESWMRRPLRTTPFLDGVQAIEWTVEERGLAGLSALAGVPWTMPMEAFFEAWIETVFRVVSRLTGGQMRVGRKRETTHPLAWHPPYLASQRSLVPDLWIEWESTTMIVDAKYKRHWEELQHTPWSRAEERFREDHRADILQVLAYANLARTPKVIACLAYPCALGNWESLRSRDRLVHLADVTTGTRSVQLWLTAVPMAAAAQRVAGPLVEVVRRAIQ